MSQHYIFRNVDEAVTTLSNTLYKNGNTVSSGRTGVMLELRNLMYDIRNPQERWISYKPFKQSKLWAYSEVLTEFLGLNPPLMERYTTNEKIKDFMRSFHRQDGRHNYTYGERWHNNQAFQGVLKRLKSDLYTRQAVMNIYDASMDLRDDEFNVPCTIIHQFLVRTDPFDLKEALYLNVYMRSNDFFKGFKYDTFLNSFILEAFACVLGVKVGILTFFIGSFHVYESDFVKLERFVSSEEILEPSQYIIPQHIKQCVPTIPLTDLNFEQLYDNMWTVKNIEEKSQYTDNVSIPETLHPYFVPWAEEYIKFNLNSRGIGITGQ